MKTCLFAPGLALALGAALSLSPCAASAQTASGRYSAPPPVALSPDLSAPWMLQLRRAPVHGQRPRVELARPRARVTTHRIPAFQQWQPRGAHGLTPLAVDPVRRDRMPREAVRQASVQPQATPRQSAEIDPKFEPQIVAYDTGHAPGTVIIDTEARFLYLVEGAGKARRYGVGVGKPGFEWAGTHKVSRKAEWPDWRPPRQMIEREAKKGRILPEFVSGGPDNPLGARALYLGSTLYRVHGTNQPWTIGKAVSSGCIRMRNQDVIDLYERVPVGAKVVVS